MAPLPARLACKLRRQAILQKLGHANLSSLRPHPTTQRGLHVSPKITRSIDDIILISLSHPTIMDADLDKETLEKLQELLKTGDGEKPPSIKQILELVENADFTEEMKKNIRGMLTGNVPKVFGDYGSGSLLAVLFIFLVFAMLVFFGYKLYKSIKEKEKKREEKKKAKQMKKKK